MTDKFPARVTKSGSSKVITIPHLIAADYQSGEIVNITIEHKGKPPK